MQETLSTMIKPKTLLDPPLFLLKILSSAHQGYYQKANTFNVHNLKSFEGHRKAHIKKKTKPKKDKREINSD